MFLCHGTPVCPQEKHARHRTCSPATPTPCYPSDQKPLSPAVLPGATGWALPGAWLPPSLIPSLCRAGVLLCQSASRLQGKKNPLGTGGELGPNSLMQPHGVLERGPWRGTRALHNAMPPTHIPQPHADCQGVMVCPFPSTTLLLPSSWGQSQPPHIPLRTTEQPIGTPPNPHLQGLLAPRVV